MRALITGIRGAAGSYLAEYLESIGDEVHGIARLECDLNDFAAVRRRLEEVRPEVIYHLASKADVRRSFDEPARMYGNNTGGTINLFEALRLFDPPPRVVMCSSSEVYGDPDGSPITELFPISRHTNPYACSKAGQDLLAQMYARCYGIPVIITRAFGYINPRRRDIALSAFARQIVEIERGQRKELIHGNLGSVRTFADVRDIVIAYALAGSFPPERSKHQVPIYNIGSEEPMTVQAGLEMMIEMARVPVRTRVDPALMRPLDVRSQVPDCSRFRAATGWHPQIPLHESLSWLLDHYRAEADVASIKAAS
jgi:GDPmannose 4,6-dehydratase/GDP-4-dehydro-6-deoxy-D-mannose reductase